MSDNVMQGPPKEDHYGHKYNGDKSVEGYDICVCGARENTPVSAQFCMGDGRNEHNIKYMPIQEFWELGFIQELNRRFMHPRGLAFEVIIHFNTDGTAKGARLGGIWDYRADPEGIAFEDTTLSVEKFESVERLLADKEQYRSENLGYVIQPIPGVDGPGPIGPIGV